MILNHTYYEQFSYGLDVQLVSLTCSSAIKSTYAVRLKTHGTTSTISHAHSYYPIAYVEQCRCSI